MLLNPLRKRAAGDELRHQQRLSEPEFETEDNREIRVCHERHHPRLAPQPPSLPGIRSTERLHGDGASKRFVLSLVNDSHAARTNSALDSELARDHFGHAGIDERAATRADCGWRGVNESAGRTLSRG